MNRLARNSLAALAILTAGCPDMANTIVRADDFAPYYWVLTQLPPPDSASIPQRSSVIPRPEIRLELFDAADPVSPSSVRMLLDGIVVSPLVRQEYGMTAVTYTPAGFYPEFSMHEVEVTFTLASDPAARYGVRWPFAVGPYVLLPETMAGPLASGADFGFTVRTVQAPTNLVVANGIDRALRQLNGTLTAPNGSIIANEAVHGPNADGSYPHDGIIDFSVFQPDGGQPSLNPFPGIPGTTGHSTRFATEVVGFLELPAGVHTLGVTVAVAATDVLDDDGFVLWAGANPRDALSIEVGRFTRVVGGHNNWENSNEFNIVALLSGVYGFRLVYFQTGQEAKLVWYSVDPSTGERVHLNLPGDPRAIRVRREGTLPEAGDPALVQITPAPFGSGVPLHEPLHVLIDDGVQAVNPDSVRLWINQVEVQPLVERAEPRSGVRYTPPAGGWLPTNLVRLDFADTTLPAPRSQSRSWWFQAKTAAIEFEVAGLWNFDQGDLSAAVGMPLEYFDGPNGETAQGTLFGATTDFGLPDLDGQPAHVMKVPGDLSGQIGYVMRHGIPANGGGQRVNQFTIIMDLYWPRPLTTFGAMINYDLSNKSDGDFFFRLTDGGFGQGDKGYEGNTRMEINRWHRVSWAVDMAADPPLVTKYLDGVKHADWIQTTTALDNDRRSMPVDGAVLFGDGDADERMPAFVNSIQVRAGKVPDAALAALGSPSASGIPLELHGLELEPPCLHVRRLGNSIELSWEGNPEDWILETADRVPFSDWQPFPSPLAHPMILPASDPMRCFRLKQRAP
ncbi:MAG: hypothetical protein KA118_20070 [Verrucomicrobia bacterium]|nr:hypothetical protein [Verrucomicrobiota bacterium]